MFPVWRSSSGELDDVRADGGWAESEVEGSIFSKWAGGRDRLLP